VPKFVAYALNISLLNYSLGTLQPTIALCMVITTCKLPIESSFYLSCAG